MTPLQGVIRFWESKLKDKALLNESTIALIELTLNYLKEYEELKSDNRKL